MAKNKSALVPTVLALVAGFALGGLIYTWVRPFPGGATAPTQKVPANVATPQTDPPVPAVQRAQPSQLATPLTPPPEDDQVERRPARRTAAKPAVRQSDQPPMTERPPIVTSPVPLPPPVTPAPVPEPPPVPSSPARRRAVQETDSEAGVSAPTTNSRQSNGNGDSSGRPVLHRARNSDDTNAATPAAGPVGASASAAYSGPMTGSATWTGKLEKNQTLTIIGGIPSIGVLSGAPLPGVSVNIRVDQTNLGFAEMPSPSNNFGRLVLKSHSHHDKITFHWTVVQ